MEDKISVVIPLYNKAPHIKRTLNSVFNQTYQPLEIIVVDDGSTDGGGEIVASLGNPLVRLIRQENAGVSAARNRGIQEAKGELIAFLDADDEWLPEFLITIKELRRKFPDCGMYATGYQFDNGNNSKKRAKINGFNNYEEWTGIISNFYNAMLRDPIITASSIVIPKTVFCKTGEFPINVEFGEDLEMWLRIASFFQLAYDTRVLATYHLLSQNRACSRKVYSSELTVTDFALKLLSKTNLSPSEINSLQKLIVKYNVLICRQNLKIGNSKSARNILLIYSPSLIQAPEWYFYYLVSYFPKSWFQIIYNFIKNIRNEKLNYANN